MVSLALDTDRIAELAELTRQFNIVPIFLPQERRRGVDHPVSRLFSTLTEAMLEEIRGLPETELQSVVAEIPEGYRFMIGAGKNNPSEERLLLDIAEFYIIAQITPAHFGIRHTIRPAKYPDRVLERYPELSEQIDKDDLLMIDTSFELLTGGIRYKDHVLHYHQFLSTARYDKVSNF